MTTTALHMFCQQQSKRTFRNSLLTYAGRLDQFVYANNIDNVGDDHKCAHVINGQILITKNCLRCECVWVEWNAKCRQMTGRFINHLIIAEAIDGAARADEAEGWNCIFFLLHFSHRTTNIICVERPKPTIYFFSSFDFDFDGSLSIYKLNNKYIFFYYLCRRFSIYTCKTKCLIQYWMRYPHSVVRNARYTSPNEFWHIEQTWSRNWFEMNVNQPNGDKCTEPIDLGGWKKERTCQPRINCSGQRFAWPDIGHLSLFKSNYRQNAYWHISWWASWELSLLCVCVHSGRGTYAYVRNSYKFVCIQFWAHSKHSYFFSWPECRRTKNKILK